MDSLEKENCFKSQVVILQTAQTWANAGVCVDCAHALWVVHTTKRLVSIFNVAERVFI